jgi:8-hydroxy-5-deazaflavin:NADPH oxidoreductase
VTALRGGLRGRVLIDCTNPVGPGFVLETADGQALLAPPKEFAGAR